MTKGYKKGDTIKYVGNMKELEGKIGIYLKRTMDSQGQFYAVLDCVGGVHTVLFGDEKCSGLFGNEIRHYNGQEHARNV